MRGADRSASLNVSATERPGLGALLAFLVLGVVLGIGMVSVSTAFYEVEGGMSDLATLLPLGYAFAAGMVATVNPCGVLLLPSLVAYYLGRTGEAPVDGWERGARALLLGIMATLGFVVLFAIVGLIVGAGGQSLGAAFPFGGLAVGVALATLGVWLTVTGQEIGFLAASQAMGHVRLSRDLRSLFLFGVAYGICSLACTLPIFLVVVGSALATRGPLAAILQFVGYALGMGLVLTVVIVAAAFFQSLVSRWIRRIVPYVHRLSASFLIGAGIFVVHYWLVSRL
ncbi:MAG TPA: cytochrome c biogenesis protein CcdA [Chloroflexota bacterium]